MTAIVKQIEVAGNKFSYNVLLIKHAKYLPLIKTVVSDNVFKQKEGELQDKYLLRLFNHVYNSQGAARSQDSVISTLSPAERRRQTALLNAKCNSILGALGISIVKRNVKSCNVIFKNSGKQYRMKNENMDSLMKAIQNSVAFDRDTYMDVSIGVELEFIGDSRCVGAFNKAMRDIVGEDRYYPKMEYCKNKGDKWILGRDGSLHRSYAMSSNMRGYELTSPILHLNSEKDMMELQMVCDLVREKFNGVVNTSCGTHVHMSFDVPDGVLSDNNTELIRHFARSYKKSEESLFDKLVPANRRGNRARYAQSVNENRVWERYRKLNFANVGSNTSNMHLEFRQLNGTLNYETIYAWCLIQRLFIELTLSSWELECSNKDKPIQINLEDIIASNEFKIGEVEELMKMSKLIA